MRKIKSPVVTENEDSKRELSYPEENEFNVNRPLLIRVQKPYELIVLEGKTYIAAYVGKIKTGEKDRFRRDFTNFSYNAFEKIDTEHFINTVMSIDLNDNQSILDFYNEYGSLGYENEGKNNLAKMHAIQLGTSREPLEFFKTEIAKLQDLIVLYEAVKSEDDGFIRKNNFLVIELINEVNEDTPREELFSIAKSTILNEVNIKSNLMNPVLGLINGEFTKFTTSTCLLGVFYLRFYDLVTENHKIIKCRFCGDYSIPRKSNANFCPPKEANGRSKCANNYDAMVRRIAEWHFKDKLTVEEIQKKLIKPKTRSTREIQYILDNYKGKFKK